MEHAKQYTLMTTLYHFFNDQTDIDHPITIPDLIAELETKEVFTDRRTIYKCIESLSEAGVQIQHVRVGKKHAYYLKHSFSLSEALVLIEHISSSPAFSSSETKLLTKKIGSSLSTYQRNLIPECYVSSSKTDNDQFLNNIQIILPAISSCTAIEFQYYDLTIKRKRRYRKDNKIYHLTPYAIVSDNGKYYCVFYDHKHESFSNYRLDKMDHVQVTDDKDTPVPFSLEDHMRTSMNMYHGKGATITLKCNRLLENRILEEFGDNHIILNDMDEESFTVSVKTSITPTLKSWLVLYYDQIEIIKPDSLKEDMKEIGSHLLKLYGGK